MSKLHTQEQYIPGIWQRHGACAYILHEMGWKAPGVPQLENKIYAGFHASQNIPNNIQEAEKYADLLVDAANVQIECGLTPPELLAEKIRLEKENAELLEQRKELLEAAERVMKYFDRKIEDYKSSMYLQLEKAILKAKGKQ